jgi:hypothetical protein
MALAGATSGAKSGAKSGANGLYRPIPDLLRVVSRQPHAPSANFLNRWDIDVAGMTYPADNTRAIVAYVYRVGGLSTRQPPSPGAKHATGKCP